MQTVVHDHLVSAAVLSFIPEKPNECTWQMASESELPDREILIHYARKGLRVVRLKGGDVFLFGRGGEECLG